MNRLTIADIIRTTGGTLQGTDPGKVLAVCPTNISIDSRTLQKGDLFFALPGDRLDGHTFLGQVCAGGASAAVVARHWVSGHPAEASLCPVLIQVDDTIQALQAFARFYRSLFPVPVVAVTGTNGKTTTKDMIWAALSTRDRCQRTEGNFNNHIGLPLTLLQLKADSGAMVVELAMRAPGEIARLAHICAPQFGVITNVGPAHIQFFPSIEAIARAKGELLDALGPADMAVLNADDPLVMSQSSRMRGKVVTFGLGPQADFRAHEVETLPGRGVMFRTEAGTLVELPLPGRHMVYNALAAIAVGRAFSVPEPDIAEALAGCRPQPMRMEMIHVDGLQILNDAYNANPVSMRAALETLLEVKGPTRRIAVLGDMLELGDTALESHRQIGRLVAGLGIDLLFTVGHLARCIADEAIAAGMAGHKVAHFEDKKTLADVLTGAAATGDLILVKGSRLMGLEAIVEAMRNTWLDRRTAVLEMN